MQREPRGLDGGPGTGSEREPWGRVRRSILGLGGAAETPRPPHSGHGKLPPVAAGVGEQARGAPIPAPGGEGGGILVVSRRTRRFGHPPVGTGGGGPGGTLRAPGSVEPRNRTERARALSPAHTPRSVPTGGRLGVQRVDPQGEGEQQRPGAPHGAAGAGTERGAAGPWPPPPLRARGSGAAGAQRGPRARPAPQIPAAAARARRDVTAARGGAREGGGAGTGNGNGGRGGGAPWRTRAVALRGKFGSRGGGGPGSYGDTGGVLWYRGRGEVRRGPGRCGRRAALG